ncbi:MAG: glycosyltransferase family 39 protein [Deltaproteobacteria bacterium]|nr:glycosyltransferase family 39 protein [Deltaproteobacteria bacterium]
MKAGRDGYAARHLKEMIHDAAVPDGDGAFLCALSPPLGMRPMTVPDESRYSEIPREMIASGDWVVPRLNGVRYFEKPVLGYWVNALSIRLFGQNRFAVRLPAALATGLTALMAFFLVRRFAEDHVAPLLAAAAYLTCLLVFALGSSISSTAS